MTNDDIRTLIDRFDVHLERIDRHMLRQERVIADNTRAMETLVATLASFDAGMERMGRRLDEMGDQIRANTRAVLSMLDWLDGPGRAA